ncbi:AAA family ATPase [Flavobacterium sp. LS1R47]|uniref:AAA family ATPase n=1 Tax=Flavobacterium frigoritolerans TaxID=2987686 RepID=A0A9X2ZRI5_9FLAO|nr:AAA family ATPase [Flavobacterium frigoritolerans]MCV9933546.1 AAA family ATPase [Flavobacterium frigoritolerans]
MIHKIGRLTSIGKYRNYNATGDVAFKKLTLFYADNGAGKTTLTSIIRSLSQNKPELIHRRLSTRHTTPQSAQIIQRNLTGDITHTFNQSTGWNTPFQDIEIFDIHFVNENIYSGFEFNEEHKKQLHQFVIGAQGIALQQQIDKNKADKTASRQRQEQISQQLIQLVGNNLSTDALNLFLSIPIVETNNIDSLITSAETILTSANANSVIQPLPLLLPASDINSGINFTQLAIDLEMSLQTLQNTALQTLFSEHCQELADNSLQNPTNWLHWGQTYLESKRAKNIQDLTCPFCKQTIDNTMNIINSYTLQFNAEFNSLLERLKNHLMALQSFNLETFLLSLETTNKTNLSHTNTWKQYFLSSVVPVYNIISDETILRQQLQELINTVTLKIQNPSITYTNSIANNLQISLQTISQNIISYNQQILVYNNQLTTFRLAIKTVPQAQLELDKLRRIKKRFEAPISTLCNELISQRQNLASLTTAYPVLMQQQEASATTFFNSYKTQINHYLGTVFKTLFRIEDVVHVAPRGMATQSKIGYKLTIDGQDISFDFNQNTNAKDSLSEGDKSTIALAFFLSKLDIDTTINNKILVFDDPLSSFDSNRRFYTIQLIKDLFPKIKQAIILSHNEYFLYELSKGFSAGDKKTLRISQNFIDKASLIEPLSLETLVENEYFKHIKELEVFLRNPDLSKKEIVLGWLRNVLEAHIRFKFYRQLSHLPSNNQTFGTIINALVSQNVVFRDNQNRTTIISKLNLINGISCKPHHGEPLPDYNLLGFNPNLLNVSELANFVTDALNLIDNEI